MKYFLLLGLTLVFMFNQTAMAQDANFAKDALTIDALMKASYEVVSGEKGAKRQWERDKYLHHPKAMYSFFDAKQGKQVYLSLTEFHQETDNMVFHTAFYENEINREVRIFGNVAHVWSTYETRLEKDGKVARRGINSIQLVYENNRWYIVSWTFSGETESNRIPPSFDKN